MGALISLPTLSIRFVKPAAMAWDEPGSSIDGGRNGLGMTQSIELSGGGILTGRYECGGQEPEAHEYFNWLAARCNGSFRNINVPILSDGMGLFPVGPNGMPRPFVTGITHTDGSLFTDGAGYSQASVFGRVAESAALGAGEITIQVFGATRNLRWTDWISFQHATKGWRAYRAFEPSDPTNVTVSIDGVSTSGKQYVVQMSRPLREAITAGQRIELARPLCVMKFPIDFTLPWDVGDRWVMRPTLEFEEAF